jgi:hypothetical protein
LDGSFDLADDRSTLTYTSFSPLAVGRSYRFYLGGIKDLYGNQMYSRQYEFTTSFEPDGASPEIERFSISDGISNVATNAELQIEFSEALNALKLGGIRLYQGGEEVVIQSRMLSSNREVVTLKLAQLLQANSSYEIRVVDVEDLAGNVLAGQVSSHFTTGSGTDLVDPDRLVITPLSGSTVATNAKLSIRYSERINPLVIDGQKGRYRLYNATTGSDETLTVSVSSDGTYVELIPVEGLQANSSYRLYQYDVVDLAGNEAAGNSSSYNHYFYTGPESDEEALTVSGQSIGDGLTDVPLNGALWILFNKQLDPACVNTNTVKLSETASGANIAGEVALSSDRKGLSFIPDGLQTQTGYRLELSGVCDLSGHILADYSSSYVTGTLENDTTRPSIVSVEPEGYAQNVSPSTEVKVSFSEAIRSYDAQKIEIQVAGSRVAGSYAINAEQTEVTFTPATALPADTQVKIYITEIRDLAGNSIYGSYSYYFTTGSS